jgi:hypothetical protein
MDEIELPEGQYASFLVRLWRPAEPESAGSSGDWQGEVEHIQSGRRSAFASIGELWEFLCQPLAAGKSLREGVR